MFDMVRFWLDKGVDGFRLDIFHSIYKDANFTDNPFSWHYITKDDEAGFFQKWKYSLNQPEVFELAAELRSLADTYSPERMLIGEVFGSDENQKRFLGENPDGLNLVFLWELLNVKCTAPFLRKVIQHYELHYPSPHIPVYVFGNHDRKRLISYCGENMQMAKLLAIFQYTVRGVPVTYYGEEIGMADANFSARTSLDPVGRRYAWVPPFLVNMLGLYVNRDGCRTPMQWSTGPTAGFCNPKVVPWLPVHKNHEFANVQDQSGDDDSLLNMYRALLRLRRSMPALQGGTLDLISDPAMDENILAYKRSGKNQTLLIVLNFGEKTVQFRNPADYQKIIFSTRMPQSANLPKFQLPPYAGIILGQGKDSERD